MTVSVPSGLSFGATGQGVRVTSGGAAARFSVRRGRGTLTIRFARTQRAVTVAIAAPTLSASRSLAQRARGRAPGKVAVGLNVTDGGRATTRSVVQLSLAR